MMGRPPVFDPQAALPSFSDLSKTISSSKQSEASPTATNFSDTSKVDSNIVVTFKDTSTNKVVDGEEHISVDFINEDIKQVLRYVAELYDLNIIIPAALQGNVTVRLKNTTWESLLDAVLGPVGCTYTKHENIVQICTLESLNKEPLKTETFLLKFAEAKQIAEELKDFIDSNSGGKITFNERSNVLIITERSKNIQTFASIIEMLDKPETQVMIEAKFVEASTNHTDTRGFNWPVSISTVLKDKEEAAAGAAGGGADAAAGAAGGGAASTESTDGILTRSLNKSKALGPSSIMIKTLAAKFDFSQTESIGKTLSSPTIITMNNVPATMAVVTNYPVPNYSYNSEQGGYEISGFEEKPIGIELKVTPKVQAEFITLKIEPSLSSKTNEVEFTSSSGGANATTSSIKYPQISQKKTDSVVTIKSGYTIAIGGLMSQASSNAVDKVPILGDIPVLGKLFSHKRKEDLITNLLIFLSATQIAYDGTLLYPTVKEAKNVSQKKMYKMGLTENDLPGDALTESEQQMYQEVQSLKIRLENMIENKRLQETMADTSKSISTFTPYKPVTKARSKHKFLKMFKKPTKHTYVSNQKQAKQ
jgi:type IV pilus assembly protein PilQ